MKNFMDMSKSLMLWGYHEIFENKKPQINADERGFVIAYLRLFAFICGFLDSNIIKRSAAL